MRPLSDEDYRRIIDDETWAFIHKTNSFYPPDTFARPMAERRAIYDRMCADFAAPRPDDVTSQDLVENGVPLRLYTHVKRKPAASILYGHGGSLVLGGLQSHDDICAEICSATGYDVIAVDYRLAPEFSLADALGDMQSALEWARDRQDGSFILVGDSAGGLLAAGLAHANRGATDILGQVLIYPGLGRLQEAGGSMERHAFAPLFTSSEAKSYIETLRNAQCAEPRGHLAPFEEMDFEDLPPTVAISAECDPLADDARLYVERIAAAGGVALWLEEKGLVHAHLRARHMSKRAGAAFNRVVRAIGLIGSGTALHADSLVD